MDSFSVGLCSLINALAELYSIDLRLLLSITNDITKMPLRGIKPTINTRLGAKLV
jgi:hypothetical protein